MFITKTNFMFWKCSENLFIFFINLAYIRIRKMRKMWDKTSANNVSFSYLYLSGLFGMLKIPFRSCGVGFPAIYALLFSGIVTSSTGFYITNKAHMSNSLGSFSFGKLKYTYLLLNCFVESLIKFQVTQGNIYAKNVLGNSGGHVHSKDQKYIPYNFKECNHSNTEVNRISMNYDDTCTPSCIVGYIIIIIMKLINRLNVFHTIIWINIGFLCHFAHTKNYILANDGDWSLNNKHKHAIIWIFLLFFSLIDYENNYDSIRFAICLVDCYK